MSIGFFVEENSAVVWRGPMLHKAIQQFLEDVAWGELEYLLLDLPPGTGDVSMTLAQLLPQAKFVIVTTPQPAAQTVAKRGADMAAKFDLELLGVIENMSGFTTPDGERFTIFGEGGGQLLADELDIPLLGKVPLSEPLREHADDGTPLVTAEPDSPASQAIRQAARGIVAATPQELPVLQAAPGRGRAAAGQRHAAAGRPGLAAPTGLLDHCIDGLMQLVRAVVPREAPTGLGKLEAHHRRNEVDARLIAAHHAVGRRGRHLDDVIQRLVLNVGDFGHALLDRQPWAFDPDGHWCEHRRAACRTT